MTARTVALALALASLVPSCDALARLDAGEPPASTTVATPCHEDDALIASPTGARCVPIDDLTDRDTSEMGRVVADHLTYQS